MKKSITILLIIITTLIFSSFNSLGALTDGLISYWSFENTIDSVYRNNGTLNVATIDNFGKIGKSLNLTRTSDYMSTTLTGFPVGTSNRTMACWVYNRNATCGGFDGWFGYGDTSANFKAWNFGCGSGTLYMAGNSYDYTINNLTTNNWDFYVVTFDGTNNSVYKNNVLIDNRVRTSYNTALANSNQGATVWATATGLNGYLDECGLWNRTITTSEISTLYNNNNGVTYPFTNNLSIYGFNYWNNSVISNFSIFITNSTNSMFFNTTNGIILSNISVSSNSLWNISFVSNNFFNITYYNINSSIINYNGYMFQSQVNFSLKEFDNNVSLSNFSLNITGIGVVCNTSLSSCLFYPNNGSYNYSVIDNTGINFYTLVSNNFSTYYFDNKSINGFVTEHFINVTAKNILTSIDINNFSIHLTDLTDGTDIRDFNTTNGYILIPVIHHNYNLTINAQNYANNYNFANISVNTSLSSNGIINKTFYLYTTNSINLTFYDLKTNALLNNLTITIQFIGTTKQTNITSNGTLYVDLLTPDGYTILSSATGYAQNSYLLTLIDKTYNPINIYMTNNTNTQYCTLNIKDKYSKDPIIGATVIIQRYFNNAWTTEQMYTSDINGQVQGYFELNNFYYNIVVIVNNNILFGKLNSNSNKKIIFQQDITNGITIPIDPNGINPFNNYLNNLNVNAYLNFTNTSNSSGYFTFRWIDITGASHTGILNIYVNETINVCNNSASSSSGIISCSINSSSIQSFLATTTIDSTPSLAYRLNNFGVDTNNSVIPNFGVMGWFISILLLIIVYIAFSNIPSLSILFGTSIVGLAIICNLIFQGINITIFIGLMAVAILIAKIPSRQGGNR